MDETIHIAFAVYDKTGTYIRHTATSILSIFCNTQSSIHIHLLHDETLNSSNKDKLASLCKSYHQIISFHSVKINLSLDQYPTIKDFSIGTMFRLKIMDIFPDLEKIIYLDNDIICNMDINLLWKENINQYLLGVIADPCTFNLENIPADRMDFYNKVPIMNECYFNAGVLYLNLKQLRNEKIDLFVDSLNFLTKHPDALLPDQDALNFLFQKKSIFLNKKYNLLVPYCVRNNKDQDLSQQALWHFIGYKPWEQNSSPLVKLYWKYLKLTPWAEKFYIGNLFDCFIYNDEFELLNLRLSLLNNVVDYFVILEADNPNNPYSYENLKEHFIKYNAKIIHIKISLSNSFRNEYPVKNTSLLFATLSNLINTCDPYDLIMCSTIEELPSPNILKNLATLTDLLNQTALTFEQEHYCYYINWKTPEKWIGVILAQVQNIKSIQSLYDDQLNFPRINNGGWCFSNLKKECFSITNITEVSADSINISILSNFIQAYPYLYKNTSDF